MIRASQNGTASEVIFHGRKIYHDWDQGNTPKSDLGMKLCTVKWIENKTNVELLAIGIGHDVTRYYNQAIKITDVQDLGDVMINQLTDLFVENNNKILH